MKSVKSTSNITSPFLPQLRGESIRTIFLLSIRLVFSWSVDVKNSHASFEAIFLMYFHKMMCSFKMGDLPKQSCIFLAKKLSQSPVPHCHIIGGFKTKLFTLLIGFYLHKWIMTLGSIIWTSRAEVVFIFRSPYNYCVSSYVFLDKLKVSFFFVYYMALFFLFFLLWWARSRLYFSSHVTTSDSPVTMIFSFFFTSVASDCLKQQTH